MLASHPDAFKILGRPFATDPFFILPAMPSLFALPLSNTSAGMGRVVSSQVSTYPAVHCSVARCGALRCVAVQ